MNTKRCRTLLPSLVSAPFCFVVWLESDGLEFPRAVVALLLRLLLKNYTKNERRNIYTQYIYIYMCVCVCVCVLFNDAVFR